MTVLNLKDETHLSTCRKNAFAFLALFFLVLMIYSNTFNASWHFDDEPNILNKESLHLKSLNWQTIKQTFSSEFDGKLRIYRPAACLSFALNYYFGQEDVLGYHLVNLAIHFLAAVFLFLFIFQVLNLPRLRGKYESNAYSLAFLATILWAINPIQTQAVTYIVQRMASMAGMFYIMSMFFYVKARTSEKISAKAAHYLSCCLTAILAFSSKQNAALLPISIFLLDLFLVQGLETRKIKKNAVVFLAILLIPLGIALILRGPSEFSLKHLIETYAHREYTVAERLLTQPRVLLFYLSVLFYPMPGRLSISHDISISHSLFQPPSTLLAILFLALVLGICLFKSRKWPLLVYCILFFFLNHIIESTVFPLELVFEHRNYIPSMLLFVPVAILMLDGLRFFANRKRMRVILFAFFTLIIVTLGHSTFMRNFAWKTQESLWLSAIDRSPNLARPYHNLGRYYGSLGLRDKEIENYLQALQIGKDTHGETRHLTHHNLGLAYNHLGQETAAMEHFKKAIEIDPRFSDSHNNVAAILIRRKEYDAAFDHLITALTHDDKNPAAHHNLGIVLLKQRRLDEAISEFRKALAGGESLITLLGLSTAFKHKKEFDRARYYLQRALEKNTKNIMARLHLIETLYMMKNEKSLAALLEETLEEIPAEKMKAVVEDIIADNFPDQEYPDLGVVLPLLGKAYSQRSDRFHEYSIYFKEQGALR